MSVHFVNNGQSAGLLVDPNTGREHRVEYPIVNLAHCEAIELEDVLVLGDTPGETCAFDAVGISFVMASGESHSWAFQDEEARAAALGRLLGLPTWTRPLAADLAAPSA